MRCRYLPTVGMTARKKKQLIISFLADARKYAVLGKISNEVRNPMNLVFLCASSHTDRREVSAETEHFSQN